MILTKETLKALVIECFGGCNEIIEWGHAFIVRFDTDSELPMTHLRQFHDKIGTEFYVSSSSEHAGMSIDGSYSWVEIEIPRAS